MSYQLENGTLLRAGELAPGVFDWTLSAPQIAAKAQPGQFVNVQVPGKTLRRPISLCGFDPSAGTLRLVFQIRGEGTAILSSLPVGTTLSLLGPLGHGFPAPEAGQNVLFVGGGIGVPPLLQAAKGAGENALVCLGFRTASAVILKPDFEANGNRVYLATDDGTAGRHGFAADCARELSFAAAYIVISPRFMRSISSCGISRRFLPLRHSGSAALAASMPALKRSI
ncbi:MAG: FAD-binding oxidoreductase, partial [Candidatus Heritagella sp.]